MEALFPFPAVQLLAKQPVCEQQEINTCLAHTFPNRALKATV